MSLQRLVIASILCYAFSAEAGERIEPAMMTAEQLASYMPDGARIETRLDVDINGDGLRDMVFVARNDEVRVLKVMMAYVSETDMGHDPVGELRMGDSPLGGAALSVKKGVLIVEDLDGGTTAIQSLYRFRYDPAAKRMRLIGDDVTLYSRTNQHGSTSISTNRLTGVRVATESELEGETYVDRPAKRSQISKKAIYMEDAPTPDDTLGLND